jgi:hypothetical protein
MHQTPPNGYGKQSYVPFSRERTTSLSVILILGFARSKMSSLNLDHSPVSSACDSTALYNLSRLYSVNPNLQHASSSCKGRNSEASFVKGAPHSNIIKFIIQKLIIIRGSTHQSGFVIDTKEAFSVNKFRPKSSLKIERMNPKEQLI